MTKCSNAALEAVEELRVLKSDTSQKLHNETRFLIYITFCLIRGLNAIFLRLQCFFSSFIHSFADLLLSTGPKREEIPTPNPSQSMYPYGERGGC